MTFLLRWVQVLRTGRHEGRGYTIYPRLNEIKRFSAPAPGTYGQSNISLTGTRAPAYSFGVVCPPLSPDKTPGKAWGILMLYCR